jgi:hypothetical protein
VNVLTTWLLKRKLLAELQLLSDLMSHHSTLRFDQETKMKSALFGAAAVAAVALASPALAQPVIQDPGYCAQFYPNANCQNLGWGNPYSGGYWRNSNAMMRGYVWSAEPDDYRYHGGPKYND